MIPTLLRGCLGVLACALSFPLAAHAGTFKTIYTFGSVANDGVGPEAALIAHNNVLYGTTSRGGPSAAGTVFSFDLQTGAESIVTTAMGSLPYTPVLFSNNRLYGTTSAADNGQGNIFEVNLKSGKVADLYAFPRGPNLAYPGGLVLLGGNLFGIASNGGDSGNGSIFQYDLKTKRFTTLYSFSGGADGKNPTQILPKDGVFYGVASRGGANGYGDIFKFDPATNIISTLYSFTDGNDGSSPSGIAFHKGLIYGTALFGGAATDGTIFTIDPATNNFSLVYSFTGGANGCVPFGEPIIYKGLLYSAAGSCGSTANQGTLFSLQLSNAKLRTLHTFTNGADGVSPGGALLFNQGVLYGTASYGGANNSGTIFSYTP